MKLAALRNATAGGTAAPSAATDGVPLWKGVPGQAPNEGFSTDIDELEVLVEATVSAGTAGTISFIREWLYFPDAVGANKWFPAGGGPAADKGKLNADATTAFQFDETDTDLIRHCERRRGMREAHRVYYQLGTFTNITRCDVTLVSRGGVG